MVTNIVDKGAGKKILLTPLYMSDCTARRVGADSLWEIEAQLSQWKLKLAGAHSTCLCHILSDRRNFFAKDELAAEKHVLSRMGLPWNRQCCIQLGSRPRSGILCANVDFNDWKMDSESV